MRISDADSEQLAELIDTVTAAMKAAGERMGRIEGRLDHFDEANRKAGIEFKSRMDGIESESKRLPQGRFRGSAPYSRTAADRPDPSTLDHAGFSDFGEFVITVAETARGVSDDRLGNLIRTKELGAGTGSAGGFLIPEAFSAALLERILTEAAQIRPRAFVLPRDEAAPDAPVDMPVTDVSGTHGRLGGIEMEWVKSGGEKPETEPALASIRLEPNELAGFLVVEDKLLRNTPVLEPWLMRVFSEAVAYMTESAYFAGSGAGQPRGVLGHPATIVVPRNAAGMVTYRDAVDMISVGVISPNSIWLASQSVMPELLTMTLTGTAGEEPIWLVDRQGIAMAPLTLMGRPIFFPDYLPQLGVEGDLALCDFWWYAIKDGGPSGGLVLESTKSHGDLFRKNKTALRIVMATDGQPMLSTPITKPDTTTYSPFVVLGDTGAGS